MEFFCSFGLPYVSPSYRGDINFIMRRKIRDFYSQIGEVVSIFIDGDYTSVTVKDMNDKGIKFKQLISLDQLRQVPALKDMQVLRKGSRLSITPVSEKEWNTILAMLDV